MKYQILLAFFLLVNNPNRKKAAQISGLKRRGIGKIVQKFDLNGNFIEEYTSIKLAAKSIDISYSTIGKCCNNINVCQWFMISKPKQPIFLKMFMHCIENIDKLINLDKKSENYLTDVLTTSGPLKFSLFILNGE